MPLAVGSRPFLLPSRHECALYRRTARTRLCFFDALKNLLFLPAVFWLVWAAMGWLLGQMLTSGAEAAHEGSELIATNL